MKDSTHGLRRLKSPTTARFASALLFGVSSVGLLTFSWDASAQRAYVVYGPPPPRRYYDYEYERREPPTALELAVDAEGAIPINPPQPADGTNLSGGAGIKARVGEQIRLRYGVRVIPEVGYGYDHLFASDVAGNTFSWDMHRAFAGVRLGFGRILVPVVYGHAGYGWRTSGDPSIPEGQGVAFDLGGGLDLHVLPHFVLGAFAEYATIDAQPYRPQWLALGLHADLLL